MRKRDRAVVNVRVAIVFCLLALIVIGHGGDFEFVSRLVPYGYVSLGSIVVWSILWGVERSGTFTGFSDDQLRTFRTLDQRLIQLRSKLVGGSCSSCGSNALENCVRLGCLSCAHCGGEEIIADKISPADYWEKRYYSDWLSYRVAGAGSGAQESGT